MLEYRSSFHLPGCMRAVPTCATIPVTTITKRRDETSRQYSDALVGLHEVAGVEDAERHPDEEVDDPAENRDRGDEPGHDRIDEADEDEDEDRDDPGTPSDPA